MKVNITILGLTSVICLTSSATISAEKSCNIDKEKKQLIVNVLCGQMAPEPEYHFAGADCVVRSARARAQDTAVQIAGYQMCGDVSFALQLKNASVKAMDFVEALSVCTSEKPNLSQIMEIAVNEMNQRIVGVGCTPDLRALFAQRRPAFEKMMSLANGTDTTSALLAKIGVTLDADGNVRDK